MMKKISIFFKKTGSITKSYLESEAKEKTINSDDLLKHVKMVQIWSLFHVIKYYLKSISLIIIFNK